VLGIFLLKLRVGKLGEVILTRIVVLRCQHKLRNRAGRRRCVLIGHLLNLLDALRAHQELRCPQHDGLLVVPVRTETQRQRDGHAKTNDQRATVVAKKRMKLLGFGRGCSLGLNGILLNLFLDHGITLRCESKLRIYGPGCLKTQAHSHSRMESTALA